MLGDHDAEHFQVTVDSRCTPQKIGRHHLLDQLTNVAGDRRATEPDLSLVTSRLGSFAPRELRLGRALRRVYNL